MLQLLAPQCGVEREMMLVTDQWQTRPPSVLAASSHLP